MTVLESGGIFFCFLVAIGFALWAAREGNQPPYRERPPRVEPVDFAEEIRVIDKSRRGPGPEIEQPMGKVRL